MGIVTANNLCKYYGKNDNIVRAIDNVSISIEESSFVAIIGPSGSGKSTLLYMLGGLEIPTQGNVMVQGQNMYKLSQKELTVFRRKRIGFVFQDFNLLSMLNVYENIVLPFGLDHREIDEKYVDKVMKILEIDQKKYEMPENLSGGQQQRVAIARALVMRPAIILADEPTGNLDSGTGDKVINLLRQVNRELNQTIIIITHNSEIAKSADRIIQIVDGKLYGDELYGKKKCDAQIGI